MAIGDLLNVVPDGANFQDYEARNNPLAGSGTENVIQVRGLTRPGCDDAKIQLNLLYAGVGAGASFNFTQGTNITDLRYFKILVSDQHGNSQGGAVDINAVTTLINIVTSTLNANDAWLVQVFIAHNALLTDNNCESCYETIINDIPSNPTATLATAETVGALAVTVDGTAVADGGVHALAAATVGDVIVADLVISQATANAINTITAVTVVTDGTFNSAGYLPTQIIQGSNKTDWKVLMDLSLIHI